MRALGTDVSFWNGKVDFNKMKLAGAEFCYAKASQLYNDTMFAEYWPLAKKAGLLRGAYHYLDFRSSELSQAQLFVGLLKADVGELPPVVDLEMNPEPYGISAAELRGRLWNWLTTVEKLLGRVPMIYTGYFYWLQWGNSDPTWSKYLLWLPWYENESVVKTPLPWKKWTYWQFTGNGDGPKFGSSGLSLDENLFFGTKEELYEFSHTPVNPVPEPPPSPTTSFVNYELIPNGVNIRSQPVSNSTTFVRVALKGEILKVKFPEIRQAGYIQLADNNWVWEEYITKSGVDDNNADLPKFSSIYNLNVRVGSSGDPIPVIGLLMAKTVIGVDKTANGYSHFVPFNMFPNGGWVFTSYLKPVV